jgi:hypothetical protein
MTDKETATHLLINKVGKGLFKNLLFLDLSFTPTDYGLE